MAGEGNYDAVFSSGCIIGIHRIRQEYTVQHLKAANVTRTHAEDHKILVHQFLRSDIDLLCILIAGVQDLTLRKKRILRGFHSL